MNGCDFLESTVDEISSPARLALEAMPAMPAHANALSGLPQRDVGTDCIDASRDLMSRHAWILNARPEALFHQRITVTNAAGFDLNANLTTGGLRDRSLDDFETSTWLADLNGFHDDLSRKEQK